MRTLFGKSVLALLALGLGVGLWLQVQANATLRNEQKHLQAEVGEVARLRALAVQNQQTGASSEDLGKLQNESDEAARLRARIEALRTAATKPPKPAAEPAPIAQKNPAELWRNAGRATPDDTLHSVVWAAVNGEVDELVAMLAFDPESRSEAESLFASLPEQTRTQYGNPEKLIAMMTSGRLPLNINAVSLVEQTPESAGLVRAYFQLHRASGKPRDVTFRFQRNGSEWRLLLPKSIIEEFRRSLGSP